jgi:hypothetical protein
VSTAVPVAVVTGGVAVGKSAILREADELLVGADVPHASLELEDVARFWGPNPTAGGARPDVAHRNLASVWANYRAAGADRLLLSLLMERRSDLAPVRVAVPDARITVVRLHAPLAVIEGRLRSREPASFEQELSAVHWWVSRLEGSTFADHLVDNGDRPAREVAAEVLRVLGWLG